MIDSLRQAEQQALDDGFSGLRATWNMGWLLEGTPGADRLIEAVLPLVRLQARKSGTRIEVECPKPSPRVWVDRTMIEQVLLNLARNAMHEAGADLSPRAPQGASGLRSNIPL